MTRLAGYFLVRAVLRHTSAITNQWSALRNVIVEGKSPSTFASRGFPAKPIAV